MYSDNHVRGNLQCTVTITPTCASSYTVTSTVLNILKCTVTITPTCASSYTVTSTVLNILKCTVTITYIFDQTTITILKS